MRLSLFCIRRPVFTVVLSLLIMAFGLLGFQLLNVRYIPKVTLPVVQIQVQYPGASAQTVEEQVTNIIESELSGLDGLKTVQSQSQNGQVSITLQFRLGTNLNAAAEETRAAIAKVAYLLPPDANPPTVSKSNPNQQA